MPWTPPVDQSSGHVVTATEWNAVQDNLSYLKAIADVAASQLISSTVLGAAQASFDTSTILGGNLPTTYSHLHLILIGRSSAAVASTGLFAQFNNDTGANYLLENLKGSTTIAGAGNNASSSSMQLHDAFPGASESAGRPGIAEWLIPGYNGTTFHKATRSTGYAIGTQSVQVTGNAWANTAAITSIKILLGSGSFIAGSRLSVYGIL